MRTLPLLLVFSLLLLLAQSCNRNPDQHAYDAFTASNFGIGVKFNMLSVEVKNQLGAPKVEVERQGGATAEWTYLNPDSEEALMEVPVVTPETPQLTLIFHEEKLVGAYNRYYHDKSKPDPPFFIEPVLGVKLGNRVSDFVAALGPPQSEDVGHEWRFRSEDDSIVRLVAHFDPISEGSTDLICTSLQASWSPPISKDRGEDLPPGR